VADTRNPTGPFGGPTMTAASTRSFVIPRAPAAISSTAQAYSLNVTVVPEGPLSYLTLWPPARLSPASLPELLGRHRGGECRHRPAGSGGAVSVFVTNPTDLILDINGYFDTSSGPTSYSFYPATPCASPTREAPPVSLAAFHVR